MVWWVDRNESISEERRIYEEYDVQVDRVFQSVNVMFNCSEEITDVYDVYALLQSGVNIINVDRTKFNEAAYINTKKTVYDCSRLPQMCQLAYLRPICFTVTMSFINPVPVEKDIDFVILKDVVVEQNVIDFRQKYKENGISILLWLSKCYNDNIIDLIRASDGVVLDYSVLCKKYCQDVIKYCKQYRRPFLCLRPEISDDFIHSSGGRRKLFVVASEIVTDGCHGAVVNQNQPTILAQTVIIRNIVDAMRLAEDQCEPEEELSKLQKLILIPQLVPMTVALAASTAALKAGASAIIVITSHGVSARLVSCSSPPCPVLVITTHGWVAVQMHLYRKVLPLLYKAPSSASWQEECRKRVLFGSEFGMKTGLFDGGAKLVVLAPSKEGMGYCDGFQIVEMPFKCEE